MLTSEGLGVTQLRVPARVAGMDASIPGILTLADWRRTIAELYASIRAEPETEAVWRRWCETRSELFATHPQSPVPEAERAAYGGPFVFDYDPDARVTAEVRPLDGDAVEIGTSDGGTARFLRFGEAIFELGGAERSLEAFWLDAYGGGIYLSFRDATSGATTYGGGRYLLDTVKGADLGAVGDRLVLDFNFAYQPSCSYDPRWSCPLPPPANRLDVAVTAGERLDQPVAHGEHPGMPRQATGETG
jgi:uncharacterized protein